MLRDHGYGASASRGVPNYAPTFTGTKLHCLVTKAYRCEQLAQGCYLTVRWPGLEPATTESPAQCSSCLSIDLSIYQSVRKVYCGKMADWIRVPFGMLTGVGQGMGVLIVKREGAVLG